MLCYKKLWTVEQTFHTAKRLFSTRPIFHKYDETIRGHVFCSFLALVLLRLKGDRPRKLSKHSEVPATTEEISLRLCWLANLKLGSGVAFFPMAEPRYRSGTTRLSSLTR